MAKRRTLRSSALLLVGVIGLMIAFPTAAQTAQPETLTAIFDETLRDLLKERGVPGVAIGLVQDGEFVWAGGYGLGDIQAATPITMETRFNIGSVSKTLTAWGIMTLAEGDLIDLDAPVERYLTRWHLPESKFDHEQVTIRRILSHTAGLSVRGYHGVFTPDDILPTLEESLMGYSGSDGALMVIYEPDTEFRYSSGGYTLLQLVIEEVTGEPFAAYIERTIFEPLGMADSGYEWTPELQAVVATPYDENGNRWPQYQYVEQGSGGLYTTASDLGKFVAAAMPSADGSPAGRSILTPEMVAEMITPAAGTNGEYGLGYKLLPLTETITLIGHDGSNEGWRTLFFMYPTTGDGLVVLANSDNGGYAVDGIACPWAAWAGIDLSAICEGQAS